MRPVAVLLLWAQLLGNTNSSYHEPVLFPLIEASGAASGDLVAIGRFGNASSGALAAVLNASAGSLQLMAGPTPHKAFCPLDNLAFAVGATALASGDLTGDDTDELVFAGPRGITIIKLQIGPGQVGAARVGAGCVPVTYAQLATEKTVSPVSIVVLPFQAGHPQLLAVSSKDSQPFALLRYTAADQGSAIEGPGHIEVKNRTDFGVPLRGAGWQWRAVAASQGGSEQPLAAVAQVSHATAEVEVILLSGSSLEPSANTTLKLGDSGLLNMLIADVYGDGAPGLLVFERDTTLHFLFLGGDTGSLAHTLIAPPGGSVAMDSGRTWVGTAAGAWLKGPTVLDEEVQIFGLRGPDNMHSFSVTMVVHARPEHWMRRRASLANLRGTQEFKVSVGASLSHCRSVSLSLCLTVSLSLSSSGYVQRLVAQCGRADCSPRCGQGERDRHEHQHQYLSVVGLRLRAGLAPARKLGMFEA